MEQLKCIKTNEEVLKLIIELYKKNNDKDNEFRNNIEKQKIQEKIMNEKRLEIRKAKLTKQDYRSIIRKFNK